MKYMLKFISLIFFIIMFPIVSDKFNEWFLHNKWNHSDWATFLSGFLGFCAAIILFSIENSINIKNRKEREKRNLKIILLSIIYEIQQNISRLEALLEKAEYLERNDFQNAENIEIPDWIFNNDFFCKLFETIPEILSEELNLYIYDIRLQNVNIDTLRKRIVKDSAYKKEDVEIILKPMKKLFDKLANEIYENDLLNKTYTEIENFLKKNGEECREELYRKIVKKEKL